VSIGAVKPRITSAAPGARETPRGRRRVRCRASTRSRRR
jgi:hypothetical protein